MRMTERKLAHFTQNDVDTVGMLPKTLQDLTALVATICRQKISSVFNPVLCKFRF